MVLLEHIPTAQGFWRVASSDRLKTTEHPHRHSSLSQAHHKFSAEYCQKRRLRVQNRSAGCVFSCTDTSRQQEVLRFAFENKVYQFRVLPFGLNTASQVLTHLGHTVAAYLHRQGISVIPYLDDWYHPDLSFITPPVSVNTLNMVGLKLNEAKYELEPVQDI